MALGIIGGEPARFAPVARLHREAAEEAGHRPLSLSISSHGYIAPDTKKAGDEAFPAFAETMDRIGRERGWPPMSRVQFEASRTLHGANMVGSPEEVARKILHQHRIFGHERCLLQFSVGTLPHRKILRSIELSGTEVAPMVREEVARGNGTTTSRRN
jgi:alkanesulfonate monooxygenase SsuD/methylene tetrahydromethanopterin reductase-like flavin-dependent oxidoreductase (luciferase family)